MFNLVGLGLNHIEQIKKNALIQEILHESEECYIDIYTNTIDSQTLTILRALNVKTADREFVESFKILENAKNKNISLLVSGDPLFATTHNILLIECKKRDIQFRVVNNLSIYLVAISLSGLNTYKFGRTITLTKPEIKVSENSDDLLKYLKSTLEFLMINYNNNLHTLILIDPNMELKDVISIYSIMKEKNKELPEKLLIMSRLLNEDQYIEYQNYNNFDDKKIKKPFCIILPSKCLHFVEKEFLDTFYKML
ncbi:MAG: diphthine synthase [Candidatus Anstonellales archaeon]